MSLALAAAMLLATDCDALCNARALEPFFDKLAAARGRAGRPVHILQIGDSHTAGDAITGAWRDALQARYGSGGRGVLAAGRPYAGYMTRGVTATMSDGWKIAATFGAGSAYPHPALGLAGFSLTSARDGATLGLTAEAGEAFDRFAVCFLTAPDAGTLVVRFAGGETRIALDSPSPRPECRTFAADQPEVQVDVVVEGGPATITSWATFRDAGGVAVSNVGVVGSQLVHFSRADDAVLAEELRAYRPDLIVLAFGTNEGFSPRFNPQEFEIVLRTQVGRLRRLAGNVPILLLGAPDASTRRPEMKVNAPVAPPPACNAAQPPPAMVAAAPAPPTQPAPLGAGSDGVIARIMAALRGEGGTGGQEAPPPPPAPTARSSDAGRPPLFPPAGLAAVREVQRRVAASLNLAYWDWNARMGGACTAPSWVRANPPLMRSDYVHYTSAGGREIAARLQADLDRAAAAVVAAR